MTPEFLEMLPPDLREQYASRQQSRFSPFVPEALARLALVPSWTERLAERVGFVEGLEAFLERAVAATLCVRGPKNDADRHVEEVTRTLVTLWPRLNERLRREFWSRFEQAARAMPNQEEGLTLLVAAMSVSDELPAEPLLWQILSVDDAEAQARLLTQMTLTVRRAARDSYLKAKEAAVSIRVPAQRATITVLLWESESGADDRAADFERVLSDVRSVSEPVTRTGLFLKLYAKQPEPALGGAIESTIAEIGDPLTRALFLSLWLRATGADPGPAIAMAGNIRDSATRCRALVAIALNCGSNATDVLEQAWASAVQVQDASERTALQAFTAAQWAQIDPKRAFLLATELATAEGRAEVMLATLSSEQLRKAEIARTIQATINQLPLQSLRTRLLWRLAALAPIDDSPRLLETARKLSDTTERTMAMQSLLPHLPEELRRHVTSELIADIERTSDPSTRRASLTQLVPWLDEQTILSVLERVLQTDTDRTFAADDANRLEILAYLRREKGPSFLYDTAASIGRAIGAVRGVGVPTCTAQWAQLAAKLRSSTDAPSRWARHDQPPTSDAGPFLTAQVRQFVDAGNIGSAQSWLTAGRYLVDVAGGDVEAAVLTGQHRVELSYRRTTDERHLRRYLERQEQTDAFLELLNERDDTRWALHFLGVGGVGKTMLLRHITARLAIRNGLPLPTTRVDFDHISPEFPVKKPGLLLAELADELRIYGGSSGIEEQFVEFDDRLLALHNELSGQPTPADPLANLKTQTFAEVCSSFADLLRKLPPPVILILDTCEELAKLEPIGSTLPSIEATFMVLERLHEKIPSIRVVFAGRRLLAQSGDAKGPGAWRAVPEALGDRDRNLPQEKDYLRLHVIRGFTPAESQRFLTVISDLSLDAKRREAILDRSSEAGEPVAIAWKNGSHVSAEPRANPFDIALYATWLREEPGVSEETIRSGQTDPYVEMRIVKRLENTPAVRRAFPAAVLLRRFDEQMLRVLEPNDSMRASLIRDLRGHEWMEAQRDSDLDRWFLEINPNLRRRIESYYAAPKPELELEAMRQLLAPALDHLIRGFLDGTHWTDQVNVSRLEPALRLQPPEAAASLWDIIDQRVTREAAWHWPLRVCPELLAAGNVAAQRESPLRAAIRATLNAAQLHLQPTFDRVQAWLEVAQTATLHPLPEVAEWLALRAAIHGISKVDDLGTLIRGAKPMKSGYRGEQAAACLLARVYEADRRISTSGARWIWTATRDAPELRSLQQLTEGDALDTPDLADPLQQRFADWVIPACFTDRVRLEYVLATRGEPTAV